MRTFIENDPSCYLVCCIICTEHLFELKTNLVMFLVICSDPGNNPSLSNEQQSNTSISSQGVILFLIASVIGLQQLDNAFKTHPANMWIAQVALLLFCLSYAAIPKINGTWDKYSHIIDGFRIISGTLFTASLSSIHLPHHLWFLFYAMWIALMCVVVVYKIKIKKILAACRRFYSNVMGRGFENNEHVLPVHGSIHSYNTPTLARSQNPENSVIQIIETVLKSLGEQHRAQLAAQKEQMDAMLAVQQEQMVALIAAQLATQMAARESQVATQMVAKAQMVANVVASVTHFRQLDSMMQANFAPEVTQRKAPSNTESPGRVRVRSSVGSRSGNIIFFLFWFFFC
jgi:hypothetical protein